MWSAGAPKLRPGLASSAVQSVVSAGDSSAVPRVAGLSGGSATPGQGDLA